jgi:DNA-binding MarR family transcriptional regulator
MSELRRTNHPDLAETDNRAAQDRGKFVKPRTCTRPNRRDKSVLGTDLNGDESVLMRIRLLSKIVTTICDDRLRPFGIGSTQFALLAAICQEPITRAEIARLLQLNRSTLTRDLKAILSAGWIEEVRENADGRSRPIALTTAGRELMRKAEPAWSAGQAQAAGLLGKDGVNALTNITDRILHPPTR